MVLRGSRLISFLVAFSLLSTAIVYACPGLSLMAMTSSVAMTSSMSMPPGTNNGVVKRGPCHDHKQDICKSVRDRMLSVRALSPAAEITLHALPILHFAQLDVPLLINLLPAAGPPGVLFQPVLKSAFACSNQVLRI
jgi:hypothetical protein